LSWFAFEHVTAEHPWSICQRVVGSNIAAIDGKPQSPRIYTEQSGSIGSAAGILHAAPMPDYEVPWMREKLRVV
jgi:hypothetical protein